MILLAVDEDFRILRDVLQHDHAVRRLDLEHSAHPRGEEPEHQHPDGHRRPHPRRPPRRERRPVSPRSSVPSPGSRSGSPTEPRERSARPLSSARTTGPPSIRRRLGRRGDRFGHRPTRVRPTGLGDVRSRALEGRIRLLEERREGLGDLARRLEPAGRVLGHHLGDQGRQLGRHLGADEVQRVGVAGDVGLVDVVERVRLERRAAGQEVIEGAAEAVDVGPDVGALGVEDLFGGDEVGGAEGLPLAGQTAVDLLLAGRPWPGRSRAP